MKKSKLISYSVEDWETACKYAEEESARFGTCFYAIAYREENSRDNMQFYEACNDSRHIEQNYVIVRKEVF